MSGSALPGLAARRIPTRLGGREAGRCRVGLTGQGSLQLACRGQGTLWGDTTLRRCLHSIVTLSDYVTELGHPYVWVQKLGGLHFPKDQPQARHTPSPLHQQVEMGFGEVWGQLSCPVQLLLALGPPKTWNTLGWDKSERVGVAPLHNLPCVIV